MTWSTHEMATQKKRHFLSSNMTEVLIFLGLFFLILPSLGNTQNLVKNPSFEDYLECPNALGTFGLHLKNWSTPTQGSTDYFNTCKWEGVVSLVCVNHLSYYIYFFTNLYRTIVTCHLHTNRMFTWFKSII